MFGRFPNNQGWSLNGAGVFQPYRDCGPTIVLPCAATVATAANQSHFFSLTLTQNVTMLPPTGMYDKQVIFYDIIQGGSGSYTPTWPSNFIGSATFPLASISYSTTVGMVDMFAWRWVQSSQVWRLVGFLKGFTG